MVIKFKQALFFICLLGVFTSNAQESMMPDVSYTYLEKLIEVAKKNYPRVKVYDHKVTQAKVGVTKAELSWFDIFSFNYLYSPNNASTLVSPALFNGYQYGINVNLGNIAVKAPSVRIAKEDLKIARDNQMEYDLNIEAIVKQRYFAYVSQVAILSLRTKNATDIQSSTQQLKYKFEKGEETLDNYNKGLTFYANAIESKIAAESGVLIAKSALEEILGEKLEDVE